MTLPLNANSVGGTYYIVVVANSTQTLPEATSKQ